MLLGDKISSIRDLLTPFVHSPWKISEIGDVGNIGAVEFEYLCEEATFIGCNNGASWANQE